MNKQDCKEEDRALSDDDDHDLIMSSSAKEIVDKGAIAECRWDVMSLDDKKKHIKAYNQNIPYVEFFDALNDNELNEVMSDFRHHTGIDSGIDETYVTTKFFIFSNRKYENKYRAFASQIALSSDEETFTIELNLRPVGGTHYTIEPNERDTYEAEINNLDNPISILVSSSDGEYRTVSVAVGDRVKSFTLENNEYMGGFTSEVIELMSDGIIGEQLKKVRKSKKEQDGKSEEHGNNKQEIKKNETSDLKKATRAALYVRVSTKDQAREGFSLDAQTEQLKAYCSVNNWEISDIYREEGHSCRNIDRPEYKRMMDDSDKWDVLLVLKMDRIHCNIANFTLMMDDLGRMGKEFNSALENIDTTTPIGRFTIDLTERIAQWEDEKLDE